MLPLLWPSFPKFFLWDLDIHSASVSPICVGKSQAQVPSLAMSVRVICFGETFLNALQCAGVRITTVWVGVY